MKKLMLLFSFCHIFIFGQVKIDFETGFTGAWEQFPADRWGISDENPISGFYSLKHNFDNSVSDCDNISLNFGEILIDSSISWTFTLRYNYKPSGSNKWAVYLLSDGNASSFEGEAHALILGVNLNSSDDSLRLYYQQGKKRNIEKTLAVNWEDDIGMDPVRFEVLKERKGSLNIRLSKIQEEELILAENNIEIKFPEFPEYFGIKYCYTSSKDMLLSFDDLEIDASFYKDTIAPEIDEIVIHSNNRIEFFFTEDIFLIPEFIFLLNNKISVDSFQLNKNSVIFFMPAELENDLSYSYLLNGVSDKKGNYKKLDGEFLFFYPVFKSIIFTEVLPDPSPGVYLPEYEYLELYNRWNHPVNLTDWCLQIGKREMKLPDFIIRPGDYLLIGSANQDVYGIPNYIELFTSSTILKNSGSLMVLRTPDELVIDALEYHQNWYGDEMKREGGWSLERIDLDNLCGQEENWKASSDPSGGSPGRENSVGDIVIDNIMPYGLNLTYLDSMTWKYEFNETALKGENWKSFSFADEFKQMDLVPPLNQALKISLREDAILPFIFSLPSIVKDCSENSYKDGDSIFFDIPQKPDYLDILITEIMVSPLEGAPEFIEIYNRSQKVIGLNNLALEIRSDENDDRNYNLITNAQILFYPGDYLVLSPDNKSMIENHALKNEKSLWEIENWRTLPDSEGRISLLDRSVKIIDEMHYAESQHFPLLSSTSGVSFERVFLDFQPGMHSEWHSASSLSGFSTPGYRNSQLVGETEKAESFYLEKEVFSPDNDGVDDVAVFGYRFEKEGYTGTFTIFDYSGRFIRTVYASILFGTEGELIWDGRNASGNICATGPYIAFLEAIHLSGNKKEFMETVVLIRTSN